MNHQDPTRRLEESSRAPIPPGLEDRLAAALPAIITPVRPLPGTLLRTVITLALLSVAAVGLGFLTGGKGWRAMDSDQRVSFGLLLLAGACWFSWELALRMLPGARIYSTGAMAAALASAAVVGWAWAWTPATANSKLFYLICIVYTSAGVAFGYWLTRLWLRRGYVSQGSGSWPVAGAFGLAGFTAVQLFCPFVDVAHILTSHVVPAVAGGLLAARLHQRASHP